ncbi:MAG TPA: gephyrin-like molybdotransferase Glp [Thermoplasmata archaeon]|nr:gephyrin-like molybdotransferase Glp [Thermoplasmata archaeon]
MRPLKALIPFEDARRMAMDLVRPIERNENVPLLAASGRVVAEDVRSKIDVPLADRAAMDGYAVVARDTPRAGKSHPVVLRRLEVLHADTLPRKRVVAGSCTEVATGSTIPRGADAVVRFEDTEREGDEVKIFAAVRPGQYIVHRGADIRRGSIVVHAREWLTPAKVGAIAAIGSARVRAYAKPRVSILTTGDEIVPPGKPIRVGQAYDINSQTIASVVRENGGEPVLLGRLSDRLATLRAALRRGIANDFVVFSGGSSVGERDIVVDAVGSLGDILFHGVAVKPGKPTSLGRVDGKPVLGMPGYSTSCLTNCYLLLAPMLRKMARLPPAQARIVEVPLGKAIERATGRLEFHTVRIVDGQAFSAFKESSAITSMAHADGYIEIPAEVERLEAGEIVRVTLF